MNSMEVMGMVTGLLQFSVAGYALRLNRLFGTARVGWSLFLAFFMLALLHLFQSVMPGSPGAELGVEVEVMYVLISLLLLTSMIHLETVLKERARLERQEQRIRADLESEVKKKTAYLMRAIEELQSEMDVRKQAEAEVETTHLKLSAVFRKAESAQITAGALRSVENMLKSVNVSTNLISDQMKQSKIANIVHIGTLIREHKADLGNFMTHDPRGQKLPVYIAQLSENLAEERTILSTELESIRASLEQIKEVSVMHQKCANLASWNNPTKITHLADEPCRMNAVAVA